jgi:hypothetical protein
MSVRKFGISVTIAAIVLSTVTLFGASSASAHRRSGDHHHHEHQHSQPKRQICWGVPPHKRCTPTTSVLPKAEFFSLQARTFPYSTVAHEQLPMNSAHETIDCPEVNLA